MEVRISGKTPVNSEPTKSKEIANNNDNSFGSIFDKISNNSNDKKNIGEINNVVNPHDRRAAIEAKINSLPEKNKGDVLFSIGELNKMFGIDILGENGKYIKEDLTIDFQRILYEHGSELSSSDLGPLSKYLNKLYENGLVNDEDYFATLKWIAMKQKIFQVKVGNEENKKKTGDAIFKTHGHKNLI